MSTSNKKTKQFTTFYLDERFYGIDVMEVQEVTPTLPVTPVLRAPEFVNGLINLRGQISTAIDLRTLFDIQVGDQDAKEKMAVVCKFKGDLLSLMVDRIGQVIELPIDRFEDVPDTIDENLMGFMRGVYKTDDDILTVVGVENILEEIGKRSNAKPK